MIIALDCTLYSSLQWEKSLAQAEQCRIEGKRMVWDLQMGLFTELTLPLSDALQCQTLRLALDHFARTVWPKFEKESAAAFVYRGSIDFAADIDWQDPFWREGLQVWLEDQNLPAQPALLLRTSSEGQQMLRLFCRDVFADYLKTVTDVLPAALPLLLEFDDSEISSHAHKLALTHSTAWEGFQTQLEEDSVNVPLTAAKIGVCLSLQSGYQPLPTWDATIAHALQQGPLRCIDEQLLTTQWDGLDFLIVAAPLITPVCRRKLQGFCAAGGTVITVAGNLDLPQEISELQFLERSCIST